MPSRLTLDTKKHLAVDMKLILSGSLCHLQQCHDALSDLSTQQFVSRVVSSSQTVHQARSNQQSRRQADPRSLFLRDRLPTIITVDRPPTRQFRGFGSSSRSHGIRVVSALPDRQDVKMTQPYQTSTRMPSALRLPSQNGTLSKWQAAKPWASAFI
ncbi:hypothetical protein LIA77_11986 [Sarocladium implicatum]|nr:hypothetical protein LIA77_11986 [Sarocladium implicatum]